MSLAEQIAREHPPQKVSSRGYVMCAPCAQVFTLDDYAAHIATVTEREVRERIATLIEAQLFGGDADDHWDDGFDDALTFAASIARGDDMTTYTPTPEQVEAFKKAWHEADAEGDTGNRTLRGLTAAAPYIAAEAWDEGAQAGLDTGLTITHQAENYATVLRIKREGVMEAIRRVRGDADV